MLLNCTPGHRSRRVFSAPGTLESTSSLTATESCNIVPTSKVQLLPRIGWKDIASSSDGLALGPHVIWKSSPAPASFCRRQLVTNLSVLVFFCAKVFFVRQSPQKWMGWVLSVRRVAHPHLSCLLVSAFVWPTIWVSEP